MTEIPPVDVPLATGEHEIDPVVFARRWVILGVLCTSLMIVIIGNTSLNVALPTLAHELDASTVRCSGWSTPTRWSSPVCCSPPARSATASVARERCSRSRRCSSSLRWCSATADSSTLVIADRAMMGISAAFIMPSTLSILTNVFPPDERTKAIAIWAGIAGGGAAIGPDRDRLACSTTSGGARCSS